MAHTKSISFIPAHPASTPVESAIEHFKSILVVDDHPVNRAVLAGLVVRLGYRVQTAKNGVAALEVIAKEQIDLVLMDLQMPEMDGIEATEWVREFIEPGRITPLPVIAVTGSSAAGDRERCLAAGMSDFCLKPVTLAKLEQLIRRYLITGPRN